MILPASAVPVVPWWAVPLALLVHSCFGLLVTALRCLARRVSHGKGDV